MEKKSRKLSKGAISSDSGSDDEVDEVEVRK